MARFKTSIITKCMYRVFPVDFSPAGRIRLEVRAIGLSAQFDVNHTAQVGKRQSHKANPCLAIEVISRSPYRSKCRISHFPNEHLKNLPTPTTTMKKPLKHKWTGASR
jgi:hypothetical protein